jgi:GNAT superfamily N-acetyltransferase
MFHSYLANGFGGVLAEVEGAAVGYLWWTKRTGESRPNHPHLARFGVELANDDLWIFDLNMIQEQRRHSSEFLTRAERLAREQGFRRILFCVAANNRPALWLYHRWGWKAVDSVDSIEVFRSLLISRRGVFLRNVPWSRRQAFDYRTIWRRRAARGLAAGHSAPTPDELSLPSSDSHVRIGNPAAAHTTRHR